MIAGVAAGHQPHICLIPSSGTWDAGCGLLASLHLGSECIRSVEFKKNISWRESFNLEDQYNLHFDSVTKWCFS